ncbi:MAG TPA: LysM peptidoglycan-binding domain-containing protein [Thermoanaerobaculia bacterium]|nr:LysM peptidoglycan-binding domain-containing protein [Thermoanaerobaculia bacterium]
MRRVVPVLLLVVAFPLFGAAKKSSSHPPRELHRVGDHWTAYNPPDTATWPAGSKTYTIKAGDTLWGLAQQFFKNAYMWPQLWESNTWITDAHWIYPGDVLLIDAETAQAIATAGTAGTGTTPPALVTETTTAPLTEQGLSPAADARDGYVTAADPMGGSRSPIPLGTEADVYCFGYIGDPAEPMPNSIMAWDDAEMRYDRGATTQDISGGTGDLVLLTGGASSGLVAGETYIVVESGDIVTRPGSGKPGSGKPGSGKHPEVVGRQYLYCGQVRVLCADDHQARGIITQSCMDIHIGARLKPLPQIPIPLARVPNMPAFCDPSSGKRHGYIVGAQGSWDTALGEGLLVEVNLGQADQIQPGDFLTVYRENYQPGEPYQVLGEVGILTTTAHTATGKIVAMRFSMEIGDGVEIR